jgi:hypothetical protein
VNRRINLTLLSVRVRGVFGIFVIILGGLIVYKIARGVGFRLEALPGILLGLAMMVLGYIRIRNAIKLGKRAP